MAEKFDRIEASGKIKGYTRTIDGVKVAFKDMLFVDGTRKQLDRWIDNEVDVQLTIVPINDALPTKDSEEEK